MVEMKPKKNKFKALSNCNLAIKIGKEMGLKLVNINAGEL